MNQEENKVGSDGREVTSNGEIIFKSNTLGDKILQMSKKSQFSK